MKIETLHSGDNFIYLLLDGKQAAVVDPGTAFPVERALTACGATLELIILTHLHGDHTGGCRALKDATGCRVVGPTGGGPLLDTIVQGGDVVPFAGASIDVLAVPGHTEIDLAYHLPEAGAVFTGDTLFACGCGRLFGADPITMWSSLCRLRALPPETRVYGGHDYTLENLQFAAHLDPDNAALQERLQAFQRREGTDTEISTIAEERQTNPFLRCDTPELAAALGMQESDPAAIFAEIRHHKDRW